MQGKTNIYDKLIVKDDRLNLKKIIHEVRNNLPIWHDDPLLNQEVSQSIAKATHGDSRHIEHIKNEIQSFLTQKYSIINEGNIDNIIGQYHIDYYSNLFRDEEPTNIHEKNIYNYFEKYKLYETDFLEVKYKRLVQIVFQENYGLSVIDELANDINNVDEVYTNSYKDVRIQFKGLKRKVANLFFENEETYIKVVANATSYDSVVDISLDEPKVLCSRANGSRVTGIFPKLGEFPYVNIRNFNENIITNKDLIREGTFNEVIQRFDSLVSLGLPNFCIIGPMGAGKTTLLRSRMGNYDDNLGLLCIEASNELRLAKYYSEKDVRVHIYSKKNPIEDCLEVAFRESRDIILQGEVRTPMEAYMAVYVKMRVARGSGDTYHAAGFEEFMVTRRNLLMQTGLYKDYKLAELDIALSEDLIYQLAYNEGTGRRYISKISEIEVMNDNSYRERVIFKYDKNKDNWLVVNSLSDKLLYKLSEKAAFTDDVKTELMELMRVG